VWVAVLGGDVESEGTRILDGLVSQLNKHCGALHESLFEQDRTESRIELLPYVFQQNWITELNCILQSSQEVRIRQLNDVDLLLRLHFLNPFVGLPLWIDA